MVATVIFYETTGKGGQERGRATFDGKELVVEAVVEKPMKYLLSLAEDPLEAFQMAPEVFDGHYFLAEFVGEKGSAYSGNWGHRGGGGPGKGGSTGGTGLTVLGLDSDAPIEERRAEARRVRADRNFEERASEENEISDTFLGGGMMGASLVEYEGDGRGVWKYEGLQDPSMRGRSHDGNAEVAASRLDAALGLGVVPKTVHAKSDNGDRGTSQRFIENATLGSIAGDAALRANKPRVEEMALLDYVTQNRDRHDGNWLVDPNGRLWAIDNGHAKYGTMTGMAVKGGQEMIYRAFQPKGAGWSGEVTSHKLSPKLHDKVKGLTRDQFDKAMSGVGTERNVNTDYAWRQLQEVANTGELQW